MGIGGRDDKASTTQFLKKTRYVVPSKWAKSSLFLVIENRNIRSKLVLRRGNTPIKPRQIWSGYTQAEPNELVRSRSGWKRRICSEHISLWHFHFLATTRKCLGNAARMLSYPAVYEDKLTTLEHIATATTPTQQLISHFAQYHYRWTYT